MDPPAALRRLARRALRRAPPLTPRIDFDPVAPAVVLSPHLDDAVLGCWTLLEPGAAPAEVVNVCTGLPPEGTAGAWDRMTGAQDSRERMGARLQEDRRALESLSRQATGLGFLDLQYRGEEPLASSEVLHALAGVRPVLGPLYVPAGIGAHPDHLAARDVGLELARRGFAVTLYADMPYAIEFGWPRWVVEACAGTPPPRKLDATDHWRGFLAALPWPDDRLRPRVTELSEEQAERKLVALRMYDTQFDGLDAAPHHRLSNPLWRRYEVRWELRT